MTAVARRYGEAMFQVASEQKKLPVMEKDLALVADTIRAEEPLRAFLAHPAVTAADKKQVLEGIFRGRVAEEIITFLAILVDKRRIGLLQEIALDFHGRALAAMGVVEATVESARDLSDDDMRALAAVLGHVTGKSVRLATRVKPDLLGGVRVYLDDRVIDGSIKRQLDRLKANIRQSSAQRGEWGQ